MSSELGEDHVVQLSTPQLFITDSVCSPNTGRLGSSHIGVELGRRLLLAARAGDTATVLELMAKGAPFSSDWLGTSPLHVAAANNHADTCAVLLRAGVSRNSRTKVDRTPLHLAAHAGHADVLALLLKHGAFVNCRDSLHMTPLHWASARGHEAAARVLLAAGADAGLRCKFGLRALDLATRHHHIGLEALLTSAGTEKLAEVKEPQEVSTHGQVKGAKVASAKPQDSAAKEHKLKMNGSMQDREPASEAAVLLRRHGITLLPADTGSTLLTALQSGRTVKLSDAGKLLLKESSTAAVRGAGRGKLTLNKLVQPAKAPRRAPLKIVLNRSNLGRLLASAGPTEAQATATRASEGCSDTCPARLELAAVRSALAEAREQLAAAQSRLAVLDHT